jgi:hypothetical protein
MALRRVLKIAGVGHQLRHVSASVWSNSACTPGFFITTEFEYFSKICGENSSSLKSDDDNNWPFILKS